MTHCLSGNASEASAKSAELLERLLAYRDVRAVLKTFATDVTAGPVMSPCASTMRYRSRPASLPFGERRHSARPNSRSDALVAPDMLRPFLVNWEDVVRYFIRSVEADAAADGIIVSISIVITICLTAATTAA
jgi:hypothetical protein